MSFAHMFFQAFKNPSKFRECL